MGYFYPEWQKIIRIGVTNPPTTTGYQVVVTIPWQPGMKDDFSDLRFSDYLRTLPYWIETSTTRSTATVWVKLTEINEAAKEFFCYYGNGGAASVSSGTSVFNFFDNFNRADSTTIGNNWTEYAGNWTISSNKLIAQPTSRTQTYNFWNVILHAHTWSGKMMIEAYTKRNTYAQTSNTLYIATKTAQKTFQMGHADSAATFQKLIGTWSSFGSSPSDTYAILGIVYDYDADKGGYYTNRILEQSNISPTIDASGTPSNLLGLGGYWQSGTPTITVGWVLVRLWQSTEPTCTPSTYGINTAFYQAYLRAKHTLERYVLTATQHLTHIDLTWN